MVSIDDGDGAGNPREQHEEGRNGPTPPGGNGGDNDFKNAFNETDGKVDESWRADLPTEDQVRAKPTSVFGKARLRALGRLSEEDLEAFRDLVNQLCAAMKAEDAKNKTKLALSPSEIIKAVEAEANKQKREEKQANKKDNEDDEKPSLAEHILAWVMAFSKLFTDPFEQEFIDYKDPRTGVLRTRPVQHVDTGRLLSSWPGAKVAPPKEVLDTVVRTLETRARQSGVEYQIHLRFGWHNGELFINRCSADGTVIRVGGTRGVCVIPNTECPLRFSYHVAHGELPVPVPGGSLDELWKFVRVQRENDKIIVKGVLVGFYDPEGPYPVVDTFGPYGSGKTSGNEFIAGLLDPSLVSPGAIKAKEDDMMISLQRDRLGNYDNARQLTPDQTDMLCRINQGTSFSTRKLYTTSEEVILHAKRMVLLNGIPALLTRPDLADRALSVKLERISEETRQTRAQLRADFAAARPRILWALLNAIADGPSRPKQKPLKLPRLADHATWVVQCERGLGLKPGEYIQALQINAKGTALDVVTSTYLGAAVVQMQARRGGEEWTDTPTATLEELNNYATGQVRRSKGWPQNEDWLTKRLKALVPAFKAIGIEVETDGLTSVKKDDRHQGARCIRINGEATAEDFDTTMEGAAEKAAAPGKGPAVAAGEAGQPKNTISTGNPELDPQGRKSPERREKKEKSSGRRKSPAKNSVDGVDSVGITKTERGDTDTIDTIDTKKEKTFGADKNFSGFSTPSGSPDNSTDEEQPIQPEDALENSPEGVSGTLKAPRGAKKNTVRRKTSTKTSVDSVGIAVATQPVEPARETPDTGSETPPTLFEDVF